MFIKAEGFPSLGKEKSLSVLNVPKLRNGGDSFLEKNQLDGIRKLILGVTLVVVVNPDLVIPMGEEGFRGAFPASITNAHTGDVGQEVIG